MFAATQLQRVARGRAQQRRYLKTICGTRRFALRLENGNRFFVTARPIHRGKGTEMCALNLHSEMLLAFDVPYVKVHNAVRQARDLMATASLRHAEQKQLARAAMKIQALARGRLVRVGRRRDAAAASAIQAV